MFTKKSTCLFKKLTIILLVFLFLAQTTNAAFASAQAVTSGSLAVADTTSSVATAANPAAGVSAGSLTAIDPITTNTIATPENFFTTNNALGENLESLPLPVEDAKKITPTQQAMLSEDVEPINVDALKPTENKLKVNTDSLTGSLIYTFPVDTPPGRNEMQPDLKIIYNNQAADDPNIVGSGWSINIPYIERINKKGVDRLFTDNYFNSSLTGELSQIGSSTSYGSKIDNGEFLKYLFSTSTNSWLVTDKKGTIYKFGQATSTRQDNPSDATKIFKWMLDEARDTNNNYIKYEYYKNSGQIYPDKIKYTGYNTTDGIFEVDFSKETRNDSATSTSAGFAVRTVYRINQILAKINGTSTKSYQLNYQTGEDGATSLLSSITESGKDEQGNEVELPATTFGYQNKVKSWSEEEDFTVPVAFAYYNRNDTGARLADVNGDGLVDIVQSLRRFSTSTRAVYLNKGDGSGWQQDNDWSVPIDLGNNDLSQDTGARLMDVNGDGLVDIVQSLLMFGTSSRAVYLNKGDGTGWQQDSNWILPVDFANNDTSQDAGVRIADVNGDGLEDIVQSHASDSGSNQAVYLNKGDGTGWQQDNDWSIPVAFAYHNSNDTGARLADVNGDGLVDIVLSLRRFSTSTRAVYLNKGDGTGWQQDNDWVVPVDLGDNDISIDTGARLVDVNGDGLVDIVQSMLRFGTSSRAVYLNKGDGTGWQQDSNWNLPVDFSNSDTSQDTGARIADVNGDGLEDIVRSHSSDSGNTQAVYIASPKKADVLSMINDSQGARVSVVYKNTPEYSNASSTLLNPKSPVSLQTVYQISVDDGLGSIATSTYTYSGGEYYFNNSYDRKFAGFHNITKIDPVGNVIKDYYHQGNTTSTSTGEYSDDISKVGKVYRTEIYDESENLYSKAINKWENYDLGDGRDFVKLTQTIDFNFDGDTDHKDKATTYNYENTYGNLNQKTFWGEVTGSDNGTFSDTGSDLASTTISYAASTTPYIVGLPSQETTYDQENNKVKETKYYYDSLSLGNVNKGNATKQENWKSGTSYIDTEKTYNDYGLVTQDKNPRDKATNYTYDQYSLYVATSTNPLSQSTDFYYDYSSGKVKKTVDVNDREFQTVYDGLDRVVEEKQPDIESPSNLITKTAYTYNDATSSRYIKQTNYLNGSSSVDIYAYLDGLDRSIQIRNRAEESNTYSVKDFQYNKTGLLEKESLPYFSAGASSTAATTNALYSFFSYDPLARVVTAVNIVGTTTNSYDDWKTTVTDAENNSRDLYKDAYDNLVKVDEYNDANTYTTEYGYNLLGKLTKIEDALSNERNFTYDGLGRLLTSEDLHASSDTTFGSTTLAYDDSGNLASKTDAKNQTVNYTYDDLNRPLTEDYTGQGGTEISYGYDYGTDGKGRLTSATTTDAVANYSYNALGLTEIENKKINSTNYQTEYDYDRQGNTTYITYPDNAQVRYEYNNGGLLEKVSKKESGESVFTDVLEDVDYNSLNQIIYQKYKNGAENYNTYNSAELYRLINKFTLAPDNGESGSGVEKMLAGMDEGSKSAAVRIPGKEEAAFYNEISKSVKTFIPQSAFPDLVSSKSLDRGRMLLDSNSAPDRSTNMNTEDLWLSETITYNPGLEDDFNYWSFYTDNGATNSEDCTVSYSGDCSEKIIVNTAGSDWEATLMQGLKVDENVNYILKFKAKAATSTSIHIGVNQNYSPWYSYGLNKSVNISTGWQEYEYSLSSWATDENARIYFAVGQTATTFWFDDIELVPDNLNQIKNSSFEDDFNFWTFWSYGNGGASGTNAVICTDGTKGDCSDHTDMDADGAYWQVQLIHGISVDSSEDYIITFDAKASAPRNAQLVFAQDHDPWWDLTSLNNFALSTDWQKYEFELSPSQTDADARLSFYLGEDSADVNIDNVKMRKKQNTKITDLTPEFSAIYQDYDAGDIADDYQIQVIAKGGDFSDPFWDSGKISMSNVNEGSSTPDISYAGEELSADGQKYYWRVRLWDDEDACGQWTNGKDYFIMAGRRIQDINYTYDNVGNITEIEDLSDSNSSKTTNYQYDDLYRLTRASTTAAVNGEDYLQTYSYNAIGNITNKSDIGDYTYTDNGYNNPHAVTSVDGDSYAYDHNGNLTSDSQWTHSWDYRNRLTQSTDGTTTIRYSYDDQNNRVLYSVNGVATTTTVNKYYAGKGATSTKNIYAAGQLIATVEGNNIYYVHADHLTGANVITNTSGAVEELIDYYPFGGIRLDEKESSFNEKKKFTGHEYDMETGLNYMIARYQNPAIGRFISQDHLTNDIGIDSKAFKAKYGKELIEVLSDPQGLNSYSYVVNNPIKKYDPSGKSGISVVCDLLFSGAKFLGKIAGPVGYAYDILNPTPTSPATQDMSKDAMTKDNSTKENASIVGFSVGSMANQSNNALNLLNTGEKNYSVYVSYGEGGKVDYVGMTNNLNRRGNEWLKQSREIKPISGLSGLTKNQARGVEQSLIEHYGLENLANKINSISVNNKIYEAAKDFGTNLLKSIKYIK